MTYKLYTWPAAMMAAALLAFSPYGCDTQPAAPAAFGRLRVETAATA